LGISITLKWEKFGENVCEFVGKSWEYLNVSTSVATWNLGWPSWPRVTTLGRVWIPGCYGVEKMEIPAQP
jgi:hypothetical protein